MSEGDLVKEKLSKMFNKYLKEAKGLPDGIKYLHERITYTLVYFNNHLH